MKSALATAGATLGSTGGAPAGVQEFYQLRTYTLRNGPQGALCQGYFEHALIPALNRMGITPVGAFKLDIGPETPKFYVLIPSKSVETLATLDARLAQDAEFVQAARGFWEAPATAPAFNRVEYALLSAFSGWPKLTAPAKEKRIFQLRTYESPSHAAHTRKVAMFNEAEIAIFVKAGLTPVFFGDTIVGSAMPSLTYMLSFPDVAELGKHWANFGADPAWRELSHKPGNTDPEIVSNISNLYLSPLACSQI
jgi:hypothetical protein